MSDAGKKLILALKERASSLNKKEPSFANFLALSVASIDPHDLIGFSPEKFENILRHSYKRLGQREKGRHLINIWRPEEDKDTPSPIQIIDIFVDDMPFLVDSVLGAIRAMGGNIKLLAHPVLPLKQNDNNLMVLPSNIEGGSLESFLHIHIDPIGNDKQLKQLFEELDRVLVDVRRTVHAWRPMLERLRKVVQDYREHSPNISALVLTETIQFLAWLADHNFTFLGMREYSLTKDGEDLHLEPIENSGLGILKDPDYHFLRHGDELVEVTEQHLDFFRKSDPLMVTKANIRSNVHRRSFLDLISVKTYDEKGSVNGELRMVGLFTSMSLTTPHIEVPFIRRKISQVMKRSGYAPKSHAGKALMAALDNYPREEIFQIDESLLLEFVTIISTLPDRPQIRVLPRIDPFDNFVSVLLFLPRDRYTSNLREQIGQYLAKKYKGHLSAYYPHFPEGELVRVHYIIGRREGKTPVFAREILEEEVCELTKNFGDKLIEAASDPAYIADYRESFSPAYQTNNSHIEALKDIAILKQLEQSERIAVRFSAENDTSEDKETNIQYSLRVYHVATPIPLSDRVPMLENFGFKVIDERSYEVRPLDKIKRFIHHMIIEPTSAKTIDIEKITPILESAIIAVWDKEAENDGFNELTTLSALTWDNVAILRAMGRYLKQLGVSFSQRYMWNTLCTHKDIASNIVELFYASYQPNFDRDRKAEIKKLNEKILAAVAKISAADEDRIIRHFLNLIDASMRTNFFQRQQDGSRKPALAIKFDCHKVDGMPEPRLYREIFVYSPEVEGIHMRGGAIARGGLRWSDRPEDFRTEVLGLVKAQMVKNAVIVPVGSKGGFVPKTMPANPDRETFMSYGTNAYKIFIGTLLDVTDNLDGNKVITPPALVRKDGDDPYLVVAADKGTATFSDMANAISEARGFWLGDAFASGGSVGYDHKKMGITARGGWEAVKRHFREMDKDIQTEPFSVIGVGDMSGDVFGNGMLLSKQIKLLAAFDHRDIFIDPDPDVATSFAERKRLFEMGRSSWQDYNKELLSKGGGIYSRSAKTIKLSQQATTMLGLKNSELTPIDLMNAILKSEADLLWFGGIGTYVRASSESDADADDRANDNIRITGKQVRAKVIGEGANLGITQLGRIEFALNGGRINTDAIDNSAGVNSSDLEVNIKIALGSLVREGKIDLEQRNEFLASMTDEVAELCLRNNYLQTLALSLIERRAMRAFPDLVLFMHELEQKGELDRQVEFLPDDVEIADRASAGQPFVRPELAVLLAYAKNTLYAQLLKSKVPDDPYLSKELYRYFPEKLKQTYIETIDNHRLRREVIATVLCNAMINRGGPSFVHRMMSATTANEAQVAFAYAAARDVYDLADLNGEIDKLDNKIRGKTQLELYAEVLTLQVEQTLWFLRNVSFEDGLGNIVARYHAGVKEVRAKLSNILPDFIAQSVADQAVSFVNGGAPLELARRIAELSALTLCSDIVLASERTNSTVAQAAKAYFTIVETFKLGRITEHGGRIDLSDRFDRMALDRAMVNVMRAQRDLTCDVLLAGEGEIADRYKVWHGQRAEEVDRIIEMVSDLTGDELTVSRLSVAAGLLSDLVRN